MRRTVDPAKACKDGTKAPEHYRPRRQPTIGRRIGVSGRCGRQRLFNIDGPLFIAIEDS